MKSIDARHSSPHHRHWERFISQRTAKTAQWNIYTAYFDGVFILWFFGSLTRQWKWDEQIHKATGATFFHHPLLVLNVSWVHIRAWYTMKTTTIKHRHRDCGRFTLSVHSGAFMVYLFEEMKEKINIFLSSFYASYSLPIYTHVFTDLRRCCFFFCLLLFRSR